MKELKVYTDGACRGNPGPGGWAGIILHDTHQEKVQGFEKNTTNNRMELSAVIYTLKKIDKNTPIMLHTDSQYVMKGMMEWVKNWEKRGWRTSNNKPVKNMDLWKVLVEVCSCRQITWKWVKGHSGDQFNELADSLANQALDQNVGA